MNANKPMIDENQKTSYYDVKYRPTAATQWQRCVLLNVDVNANASVLNTSRGRQSLASICNTHGDKNFTAAMHNSLLLRLQ